MPRPTWSFARLLLGAWRWLVRGLVFAFVLWHLLFLAFRNPLDLYYRSISAWTAQQQFWKTWRFDKLDRYTAIYGDVCGIEQGWRMFGSPLARATPFPAIRLEFADGTSTTVYSPNEPDPTRYIRLTGCRQRKLEDYVSCWSADDLVRGREQVLWVNYVRWAYRQWQADNPQDEREVVRLVVLRRYVYYRRPDEDEHRTPHESVIVAFSPDGRRSP